jgi:hypothetical protein
MYLHTYDFSHLGLCSADLKPLHELQEINLASEMHLGTVLQMPEPSFRLDLETRGTDTHRQFKHIHQSCLLHATHFELANKIKTTYLIDSYLMGVARLNPIAIYNAARSIIELHAMLRYVQHLLTEAIIGSANEWKERGRRYFDTIMQARFGTTDPVKQNLLKSAGLADTFVQPIRLNKARRFLAQEIDWVESHYAALCDFVHHNLSSQRTAGAFAGMSSKAVSSAGGALLMKTQAPIVQYEFPMPQPGRASVQMTVSRAVINVHGIVKTINQFPRTPFSEEELIARTGSRIGLVSPKDNGQY